VKKATFKECRTCIPHDGRPDDTRALLRESSAGTTHKETCMKKHDAACTLDKGFSARNYR